MPEHLLPEGKRIGLTDNEDEFRLMTVTRTNVNVAGEYLKNLVFQE